MTVTLSKVLEWIQEDPGHVLIHSDETQWRHIVDRVMRRVCVCQESELVDLLDARFQQSTLSPTFIVSESDALLKLGKLSALYALMSNARRDIATTCADYIICFPERFEVLQQHFDWIHDKVEVIGLVPIVLRLNTEECHLFTLDVHH